MNYFITFKNKNKVISEVSFDHYLPKAKYPFLALNLYNLIPSCKNCNSTFKTTDSQTVINPFFEGILNDIEFKITSEEKIKFYLIDNIDNNEFKIEIRNNCKDHIKKQRIKNHLEVFKLEKRYNEFKNIAKSIINKKIIYNQTYLEELTGYNILPKEKLERLLVYQDMYDDNEPFSKFKKDIWNSL